MSKQLQPEGVNKKPLFYRAAQINLLLVVAMLTFAAVYGVFTPEGVLWLLLTVGIFAFAHMVYKLK